MREAIREFLAYIRFQLSTRGMTPEQVVKTFGNHAGTPYREPIQRETFIPVSPCRGGSWCIGC